MLVIGDGQAYGFASLAEDPPVFSDYVVEYNTCGDSLSARKEPMTRNLSADVESLIRQLMATGKYHTEDDLLRAALERLNDDAVDEDKDMEAILEGLEEVDRGVPGIPLEQARRLLLQKLPEDEPA
jgi:hypothetical protein